ncbi:PAN domain-containing protein [Hyphomicrobium facile]|uniref:PAN domain-containing protein n=1 Tax=Hyphomicrobium facile TaxID=51670 RepID=A0A1I7NHV8_9HYPH|nr:PAN domain-containing protein [Hyphomicrobium facile]SFV34136.1 PAN domain-containing protein [Hyphomicrobium facile]
MQARQWMIAFCCLIGLATLPSAPTRAEQTVENGVNRPGRDYKDFEMEPSIAGFAPCQSACTSDHWCRAWTFVAPGIQGPKAHCWLKKSVPDPVKNKCCVSGLSGVIAGLEFDTNRMGSDYRDFPISNVELRDQAELLCKTACEKESQCQAWTYVKPEKEFANAHCWLKNAAPNKTRNNCCISGVVARMDPQEVADRDPTGKTVQQCQAAFGRNQARCLQRFNPMQVAICLQPYQQILAACVSLAAANAGGGATSPVPAIWQEMLKAHNDFRAQHCSPPLQWDAALAAAAQAYAETCPEGHGASNENLAAGWGVMNGVDTQPAMSDSDAFQKTWACEEKYYDYTDPRICPGFKSRCDEPKPDCKNNNPVTGHYTQVVWKSATSVGCGRAKCPFKDSSTGQTHQGTKWVCRYSNGNENIPAVLRQNVMPLGCKQ